MALLRTPGQPPRSGATSGTGNGMVLSGDWDATLRGNTLTTYPTGIVGTFQADAGTGRPSTVPSTGAIDEFNDVGFTGLVGAFGAQQG